MASFRFGIFELQPDHRRLIVNGRQVALGARAFDVLLILTERAGQLVSKSALLEQVWSGVVVEENNLHVQISTLRKVLGPQAIVTIPGRGYRLAMAPEDVAMQAHRAGSASVDASGLVARFDEACAEVPTLYGRAQDVASVRDMIGRRALVTIVGPPGIGKTRLAQAVAHASGSLFTGGVHLAELAPLADPDLVVVTVKRALSLEFGSSETGTDLAVPAVAGRRHLLVLDNCEHLLDAVDEVVGALRERAPTVHVLVTSQELLRHADEHIYRLGSLVVPDESTALAASADGAVELFVVRAQAVEPRFVLNESNATAVFEICRRLDGIPLDVMPFSACFWWALHHDDSEFPNGYTVSDFRPAAFRERRPDSQRSRGTSSGKRLRPRANRGVDGRGRIRSVIDSVYPLHDARAALEKSRGWRTRGKLVLRVQMGA